MFFTIKHGADEEALFNPDCSMKLLLDSIKKRCNFPHGASIGLAEADKCTSIINLSEQNIEMSSCVSLFTERGVYILIAITQHDNSLVKYRALLDNVDQDFALRLETLSNPNTAEKAAGRRGRGLAKTSTFSSGFSKRARKGSSLSKSFSQSRGK